MECGLKREINILIGFNVLNMKLLANRILYIQTKNNHHIGGYTNFTSKAKKRPGDY